MVTARAGDAWRSTDPIEQHMGASPLHNIDFLQNEFTWFHPNRQEQNTDDAKMAIQACEMTTRNARMILTIDSNTVKQILEHNKPTNTNIILLL